MTGHSRVTVDISPEIAYDWRISAACRGEDTDLFTSILEKDRKTAKRICADCSVRRDCLTWAMSIGDDWAVLGGLTPAERRQRNALKAQFASRSYLTESDENSETLRRCQRCRAPFPTTGVARYCSQRCRTQAVMAMRSGWTTRQETVR